MQIDIDKIEYEALDKTNEYNPRTTYTLPKEQVPVFPWEN